MKADLHCHTTLSDGSLGIEEIIAQARRNGIDHLAITDHDCLSSISRSCVLGQRYGINVIPAVEFSCFDSARGNKAHILCYMPKKPDRLEGLCIRTSEARKARGKNMAMKILSEYPIALENIVRYSTGSKAIFKCHIMHALMDYGYATELYGDVYEKLFNAKDGLCAEDVRSETNDVPEVRFALQLIHSAGGIAVVAHPKVFDNMPMIEEFAKEGMIDGIEVWHQSHDEPYQNQLLELADKYGLIATGGSDFHGFYNHYAISLGYNLTPEDSLNKMLSMQKQKEVHV